MMPKPVKNRNLYRVGLTCKIGREVLEGKTQCPDGITPLEWAMYNLLHAVEDIAATLERVVPTDDTARAQIAACERNQRKERAGK